jgi:hypothetical protein
VKIRGRKDHYPGPPTLECVRARAGFGLDVPCRVCQKCVLAIRSGGLICINVIALFWLWDRSPQLHGGDHAHDQWATDRVRRISPTPSLV